MTYPLTDNLKSRDASASKKHYRSCVGAPAMSALNSQVDWFDFQFFDKNYSLTKADIKMSARCNINESLIWIDFVCFVLIYIISL